MLAGVLSKIGVLQRVLAKVLFLLFSFKDTSVGTLASTPQSTPILGAPPQAFSGPILGFSQFRPVSQTRKFPKEVHNFQ